MRLKRFLSGAMLGAGVLSLVLTAAPASAAVDGSCSEYGDFICCRTDSDAVCFPVRPLKPAG